MDRKLQASTKNYSRETAIAESIVWHPALSLLAAVNGAIGVFCVKFQRSYLSLSTKFGERPNIEQRP